MKIELKQTDIVLRPSSLDNFMNCSYQWAAVFLHGMITIPNSRAAIGTGIHAGIEQMWTQAIKDKEKDPYRDGMIDAAVEAFNEEDKKGMKYDDGESVNSCHGEIIGGIEVYIEESLPFLDIPDAVEERYTIKLDHPIVKALSGTVDYIGGGNLDDVKTSKRKPVPSGFVIQQSIYKMLAEANGKKVERNRIQGVVLTAKPKAMILELEPDIPRAKYVVNTLLDTIETASKDLVPMETLFRCNTKYYLCSKKYCSLYGKCPATCGD